MSNPWKPQQPSGDPPPPGNSSKPLPPWMKNKGEPQKTTPQQPLEQKQSQAPSPVKQ